MIVGSLPVRKTDSAHDLLKVDQAVYVAEEENILLLRNQKKVRGKGPAEQGIKIV